MKVFGNLRERYAPTALLASRFSKRRRGECPQRNKSINNDNELKSVAFLVGNNIMGKKAAMDRAHLSRSTADLDLVAQ